MTHLVDQIADAVVALLVDETAAEDRVTRDRASFENIDVDELPTIDVRLGDDVALSDQLTSHFRYELTVYVDLYAKAEADKALTKTLLEMRTDSYKALMVNVPDLSGVPSVERILPAGADAPLIGDQGSLVTGSLRTEYTVTYRHSLTDPSL